VPGCPSTPASAMHRPRPTDSVTSATRAGHRGTRGFEQSAPPAPGLVGGPPNSATRTRSGLSPKRERLHRAPKMFPASRNLKRPNVQAQPPGPPEGALTSGEAGVVAPVGCCSLFGLLVLLLPLPVDIIFLLLAPEFRRAFPLELVPVNRQLVLDGDLVTH